jgi:hypothetical protein
MFAGAISAVLAGAILLDLRQRNVWCPKKESIMDLKLNKAHFTVPSEDEAVESAIAVHGALCESQERGLFGSEPDASEEPK